jgi:methylmalonyl-CoA/ethylmalonyl-CoA epimerase
MIKDIHHVGIAVRDMTEAYALYRDALGLSLVKEGDVPARGVKAALLSVGGSYLELVQPAEEGSPFAKHLSERGEGLHHIGLLADDVDSHVARLNEMAVLLEDHAPRAGFTGRLSYLSPLAFDGALLEVVQPGKAQGAKKKDPGDSDDWREDLVGWRIKRIDHVVMHVPSVDAACKRFEEYFGVPTKRRIERGPRSFAFLRPGDVIIEVIGPSDGGDPESGRIAGLAFEVKGIDALAASLREKGYPVGEPHAALQGGRIVSVHHSGACGVPVAFIDFS